MRSSILRKLSRRNHDTFRIEISEHAATRLKKRQITRQLTRYCLVNGTLVSLDQSGRKVKACRIKDKLLEAVFIDEKDGVLLITAYWRGEYEN